MKKIINMINIDSLTVPIIVKIHKHLPLNKQRKNQNVDVLITQTIAQTHKYTRKILFNQKQKYRKTQNMKNTDPLTAHPIVKKDGHIYHETDDVKTKNTDLILTQTIAQTRYHKTNNMKN